MVQLVIDTLVTKWFWSNLRTCNINTLKSPILSVSPDWSPQIHIIYHKKVISSTSMFFHLPQLVLLLSLPLLALNKYKRMFTNKTEKIYDAISVHPVPNMGVENKAKAFKKSITIFPSWPMTHGCLCRINYLSGNLHSFLF